MDDGGGVGAYGGGDVIKRMSDILLCTVALLVCALPMLILAIVIRADSPGPALHWSKRVGADSRLFMMPKFRSMRVGTPQVATHLLADGHSHLTRLGGFLRRSSLDELPQIWSVIRGDMSIVGPRPALFNQDDLMELRRQAGVDHLRPGITGWAQINGRDELPLADKVAFEAEYLLRQGFLFDVIVICRTVLNVFRRHGISH